MAHPSLTVILPADTKDGDSYLREQVGKSQKQLAQGFHAAGYQVQAIPFDKAGGIRKFLEFLLEENRIFITGPTNYDSSFMPATEGPVVNIFDFAPHAVFGAVGDHPSADFIYRRLSRAPQKLRLLTKCPSFDRQIADLFPRLAPHLYPAPARLTPPVVPPEGRRDIDILFPLSLDKWPRPEEPAVLAERADAIEPGLGAVLAATRAGLADSLAHAPYDHFRAAFAARFAGQSVAQRYTGPELLQVLRLLSDLDKGKRLARRHRVLASVAARARQLGLGVVVPQDPALKPDGLGEPVRFIGPAKPAQLDELVAHSRVVVNVSPSYPEAIDERVVDGMGKGAAVLTDAPPGLAAALDHGHTAALYRNDAEAGDVLADVLWPQASRIAAQGQRWGQDNHSMAQAVTQFAAAMRAAGDLA